MQIGDWHATRDLPRFAVPLGRNTWYGWGDEGPRMNRDCQRAGRSWHA